MTVYVDILLFINSVFNYAILMTTDALLKRRCRLRRLIAGAFTGAVFSLTIFLDLNSFWYLLLIRLLSSGCITLVAFGFHSKGMYLRALGLTLAVSTLYCGALILICQLFRPPRLLIAGAFTGAVFSLTIFLDLNSFWYLLLIRLLSSGCITLVAFGFHGKGMYLRALGLTLAVSTLYCGALILICQLFRPPRLLIVNDVPYFQIHPVLLIALSAVIYLLLLLLNKVFRERIKSTVVPLQFTVGGVDYRCIGKIDTGCSLTEPFSGAPVIIVDSTVMVLPDSAPARIIPYATVGGSSFLRAVKAESVTIDRQLIDKAVYIAAAQQLDRRFHAIINSDIIR